MRSYLVIILAIILTLSMGTAAFAGPYSTDPAYEGGYIEPNASTPNPHYGYANSTNHCKVCHAVHGAVNPDTGVAGEALLRSTKNEACVYCHIQASYTIAKPYGSTLTNYTNESENNHASVHPQATPTATGYKGCVSCHSVHSAGTITADANLAPKILKKNPGGALDVDSVGCLSADATNEDEFCRDCHDATAATGQTFWQTDPDGAGPIASCHSCHAYTQVGSVYNSGSRNGVSHIMTTNLNNADGTTKGAWSPTQSTPAGEGCRSCHSGGQRRLGSAANGNNFPHYTSGADFLMDTHTTTSPLDRVCLSCHQSGSSGVGLTY